MIRKFVILGLALSIIGTAALEWVLAEKRKEQRQAAYYSSKHNSELSEHLKQYQEWLRLSPQERAELPFGLDKFGKNKTDAQLLQEQNERLKADIDKLAVGYISAAPYADVLYGENWQEELNSYKKRKELRESILTSSIVCTSLGTTIVISCLLLRILQLIIKYLQHIRKFLSNAFRNHRESHLLRSGPHKAAEDNNSVETNEEMYEETSKIPLTHLLDLKDVSFSRVKIPKNESQKPSVTEYPNTNTIRIEDSLKKQVENLEKQVETIRQMAVDSSSQEAAKSQSAQDSSGPLNNTLIELTQQVAAIREYASRQQDRVKKLQEGYDLNIIKNFCIRVIRCIDNLESCIKSQSEQDIETTHLKEARDELLFALESSGVEQFVPHINSDYCGQERHAEAVKEKEHCDDPNQAGKIAEVIKPGYQYFIDEENIKVVRPAMVKLFG